MPKSDIHEIRNTTTKMKKNIILFIYYDIPFEQTFAINEGVNFFVRKIEHLTLIARSSRKLNTFECGIVCSSIGTYWNDQNKDSYCL